MSKSLYPAKPVKTDWTFVAIATFMMCFFGILLALMIGGFHAVESGLVYNNGGLLCILGILPV